MSNNQSFEMRHKPRCFDDLVFADTLVGDALRNYAQRRRYGSILLYGGYGTAKSTTAEVIVRERLRVYGANDKYFERFTGSQLRDIKVNVLGNAAALMTAMHGDQEPYVIVDEIDMAPKNSQAELRNLIDTTSGAKFIMTTNDLHKVDKGLVDRCDTYLISPPKAQHMVKRAQEILQFEGHVVSSAFVGQLLQSAGSVRDMLRLLDGLIVNLRGAPPPPPPKPPIFTVLEGGEPPPTS